MTTMMEASLMREVVKSSFFKINLQNPDRCSEVLVLVEWAKFKQMLCSLQESGHLRRPSLGFHATKEQPSGNDAVRIQRNRINAFVHEPLRELRLVRGPLATDAHVLALLLGSLDQHGQALHHCWVLLIEVLRNKP